MRCSHATDRSCILRLPRRVHPWVLSFVVAGLSLLPVATAPGLESRDSKAGYIDSALVGNRIRFRFDDAGGRDRPLKGGVFNRKGTFLIDALGEGESAGFPLPETNVDTQDLAFYLELAATERISGFVQLGYRFVNPLINDNSSGIPDMNFGFKIGLIDQRDLAITFQVQMDVPTGEGTRGLGMHHFAVQPGLLGIARLADRLTIETEFHVWFPGGVDRGNSDFLRYGVGLGYDLSQEDYLEQLSRWTAVVELVGWTFLNGQDFNAAGWLAANPVPGTATGATTLPFFEDITGQTILNLKVGIRATTPLGSLYVGYGRALTGDWWYKDIVRAEYAFWF